VAYRLLRVKAEAFDLHHGPELVNRFFDVVTVQKSAALLLMDGLSLLMQTVLGMTLLALYHPLLLAFDLFLILAILVIVFGLGRGAVQSSIKESKAKYATAAWLEEMAALTRTFKAGGAARFAMERADRLARDYLSYRQSHFRIFMRQVVGSLALQAIASAALLGVGGFLVIDRQLTLGQLVAAELIVTVVVGGFSKFGKKFETFYDLLAAIDKLGALIDLPLERLGGETLVASAQPAAVSFRDVTYKLGGRTILNHSDWEIPAGSVIGLTGPTGCGKTALADLLFGLRKPDSGVLTIDGVDFRDLCLDELREQVAIAHDTEIFTGTVMENVSVGRPGVDSSRVRDALQMVGLLDDIMDLPDGIQTQLSISGRPLSPGQSARVVLARAIAGQPRLLVLDGAFEKIDEPEQRREIADRIFAPDNPWTLLCISSQPELLRRCERLYLLDNGGLTELSIPGDA
jgi:ABC-type bacteriocin/lantibiotic exporter with double-glycine peptidase domain